MVDSGGTDADRRTALRLAAGFAVAPLLASSAGAVNALAPSGPPPGGLAGFDPPPHSMIFERVLTRELIDGAAIIVQRKWQVRFEAIDRGYALSGKQLSAKVEAPPSLAAFARMEEQRTEEAQFPIMLDTGGQLAGTDARVEARSQLRKAVALAAAQLEQVGPGDQARQYLNGIMRSAEPLISRMPRDLFYPRQAQWHAAEQIALPGGRMGEVAVTFDAQLMQSKRLVQRARRAVVTRIGQSQRRSSETWTLQPA